MNSLTLRLEHQDQDGIECAKSFRALRSRVGLYVPILFRFCALRSRVGLDVPILLRFHGRALFVKSIRCKNVLLLV